MDDDDKKKELDEKENGKDVDRKRKAPHDRFCNPLNNLNNNNRHRYRFNPISHPNNGHRELDVVDEVDITLSIRHETRARLHSPQGPLRLLDDNLFPPQQPPQSAYQLPFSRPPSPPLERHYLSLSQPLSQLPTSLPSTPPSPPPPPPPAQEQDLSFYQALPESALQLAISHPILAHPDSPRPPRTQQYSFFIISPPPNNSPPPSPQPPQRPLPPPPPQRRARRNQPQAPPEPPEQPEERIDTIEPPYPWATNFRCTIHPLNYLLSNQIQTISGDVQCKRCDRRYQINYNLVEKFTEVARFLRKYNHMLHDRAPANWIHPTLPTCMYCEQENSAKPVMADSKKAINWLFLLLGQMIGCCTLEQLKYFCKHTRNHRTGAKDRVLFSTYLELCNQLDPTGPFQRF